MGSTSNTTINTDYLKDLCATCSQKMVELRPSPLGGLGGFATARISKGQVIFTIPRDIILSSSAPAVLRLSGSDGGSDGGHPTRISQLVKDARITAETLLCADMVWKENASSKDYYMSLPTDYTQLVASELNGTNVGSQLLADEIELLAQQTIIQELLPDSDSSITIQELTRARAIYNSRRYPLRFAPTSFSSSAAVAEGIIASMPPKDVDDTSNTISGGEWGPSLKKTKLESTVENDRSMAAAPPPPLPRAVYDLTQGCLCPLLDVLNHQSGRDHLKFEVTGTTLFVIANYDIEKGNEVYSNYDCDNNDQCLLQFGFVMSTSSSSSSCGSSTADFNNADATNDHHHHDDDMDVFTVQVACQRFHLRATVDIPKVLLSDGGYGLEKHLMAKQTAQASATLSSNPFVQEYMKSQRQLLLRLLEKVRKVIQVNEAEEEEADSTIGESEE